LKYPGRPFQFSNVGWQGKRPAPLLGEHNHEVLGDELGFSDAELAQLKACGAI
jgi:crotonobetainyl-CoA:carnitine CoA-transferase CaiB-like acyl-CoA transferase